MATEIPTECSVTGSHPERTSRRQLLRAAIACGWVGSAGAPEALAQGAPSDPIASLIVELAKLQTGDLPILAEGARRRFLPYSAQATGAGVSALRELIRKGADIIPALVSRLRDTAPTGITLRGTTEAPLRVATGLDAALDDGLPSLRMSLKVVDEGDAEPAEPTPAPVDPSSTRETYTLTVGDACLLALGQILNRRWEPVRAVAGGVLLAGPGVLPAVAAKASREGRAMTSALLWQRFKDDLDAGDGVTRAGAYERLSLYFPESLEALLAPQLRRPTWDTTVIDHWLQTVLYMEPAAIEWPLLHQRFRNRLPQEQREGILHRLLEHQAANVRKRDAAAYKRQRLLLGTLYPGARTDTWPRFAGVPRRNQAALVAAMTRDESKLLDEAVAALFRDIPGKTEDDDRLALACAPRMMDRGLRNEIIAYCRKRQGKTSPELRAEMERLAP